MNPRVQSLALALSVALAAAGCATRNASTATSAPAVSADPVINTVAAVNAPEPGSLLLRKGDRLAICGDSITEQRMYSRIIETYLTACTPQLDISVRQYGWSGERADGFHGRMKNDVLRFQPTVATTCYGMNDHQYRAYEPAIGEYYRTNMLAVVRSFKDAGVRVVLGSPGCVGKVPAWVKGAGPTIEALNVNLAQLRNIDIAMARQEGVAFADVFKPMYAAGAVARSVYGPDYAVPGADGVHPDWAGQAIMAWAFLRTLGVDGNIGTITVNLRNDSVVASEGHTPVSGKPGEYTVRSSRYPFCAPAGNPSKHDNIRSGWQWVGFERELNRLTLVVKGAGSKSYRLTWGDQSRVYTGKQLSAGINLAADFPANPFSEAFARVDEAVSRKQAYETKQIKQEFHGPSGKADMEATVRRTEAERAPLAAAVKATLPAVTHTLRIQAE